MSILTCVVFVVLVVAGRYGLRAYRRRLARIREADIRQAETIREYGQRNYATLSANKYAAITDESLQRQLSGMSVGDPDRDSVKAMIEKIHEIGHPVDSFVSEETEVYLGAPHSPVAVEVPVLRRRYVFGISEADLMTYPRRVEAMRDREFGW